MKRISKYCYIMAFCTCCAISVSGQVSRQLNIPGRLQWDNANGYCGETAIQMIGLYYGNYISQDICRTVAGGELLLAVNDEAALDSFSFTHLEWDYNQATPQYTNYLVWIKQHLYNYHPVIITAYIKGLSDPDYDHIIPAIGFSAADTGTFNNTDELMYNSCYDSAFFTRTFQSIWDTRSMNGNGATYDYCIPRDVDYGCAVTGIKDSLNVTLPVRLNIDRWDEPNVTLGASPVVLHAIITASGLTIGTQYALLRYNNYTHVPSVNFNPIQADEVFYFTASANSKTYTDSFLSHTTAFYRCIRFVYNTSGIGNESGMNANLQIYPNPFTHDSKIYVEMPEQGNAMLKVYDMLGKEVAEMSSQFMDAGRHLIPLDINRLAPGTYICHLTTQWGFSSTKIIVDGR